MISRHFSRTSLAVFVLLFFSIAAIAWFLSGGARASYAISPADFEFQYIDDTAMGGNTTGKVYQNEQGNAVLDCVLGTDYRWPFCEIAISVTPMVKRGINLENYHSMVIEAAYHAPRPDQRVRVYLRNFNEAYSDVNDPVSMKFNGLEYNPSDTMTEFVLPLNSFQVLSWWISDLAIPLEHSGPELSNISLIEIATGSAQVIGRHQLEVKSIRFEGQVISEAAFFRALSTVWLLTAMLLLSVKYWQSRRVYNAERRRTERLKEINNSLKQQSQTLSIMATTDALTGLRNRTNIYHDLDTRIGSRRERSCTALCLDIDYFKPINDTYGHDMGDKVLVAVASLLRECASVNDVVVRWGGEEFVIFCPQRNLAQASFLAEKIRAAFESNHWPHDESLTCSVGVSSMREKSIAAMIADADDALYRAKQAGRNRVEVFAETLVNVI